MRRSPIVNTPGASGKAAADGTAATRVVRTPSTIKSRLVEVSRAATCVHSPSETGALDFTTGKRVLRLLVDLNRELKKTVVVITHNSALADVADRVIHLRSGELTEIRVNAAPIAPEEVVW